MDNKLLNKDYKFSLIATSLEFKMNIKKILQMKFNSKTIFAFN